MLTRPARSLALLWLALGCTTAPPEPTAAQPSASSPPTTAPTTAPSDAPTEAALATDSTPAATLAPTPSADGAIPTTYPADGFVVWESNRSGHFRLWTRPLDQDAPRALTTDPSAGEHCCPHISPDGRTIVYLRLEPGQEMYPEAARASLWAIGPDGTGERQLAATARTYFENRAAVWASDGVLHFIDGDGRSVRLDLATGERAWLQPEPRPLRGWLIDPTGRFAADGSASFAPFDRGQITPTRVLAGCQPYFSQDGRWGYWNAGAGGPINRIDLTTRAVSTVLRKNDDRLPPGRGYLYFPMLDRTGRLLAYGASPGEHDHARADYDIFLIETDPAAFEVRGGAVRITADPATDRFPDVHLAPLALGRHDGEAPLTIELSAIELSAVAPAAAVDDPTGRTGDDWSWQFGDGGELTAPARVRHTWERPGRYPVVAERAGVRRSGLVDVRPAQPPTPLEVDWAGEHELVVSFDEPVDLTDATITIEPDTAIASVAADASGRRVRLRLAAAVKTDATVDATVEATVSLGGIRDRAQQPNTAGTIRLPIPPPHWPSDRRGAVLVWQTGAAKVAAVDAASYNLERRGLATLDHNYAMRLQGGHFEAPVEASRQLLDACQASNELSIELTLTAGPQASPGARVVTLSSAPDSRNFALVIDGRRLSLVLRTSETTAAGTGLALFELPDDAPHHVVVTYAPGRTVAFLDGAEVLASDAIQGDFYHWLHLMLLIGNEWEFDAPLHGTIEGVAVYARALGAGEVAENHRRYQGVRAARPEVPRIEVVGRLIARSQPPTLDDIAPYVRALAVYEYAVEQIVSPASPQGRAPAPTAPGQTVRVAQWVWLDRQPLAPIGWPLGTRRTLALEPFEANPQVQADVLTDTLEEDFDAPLYLDVGTPVGSGESPIESSSGARE